jgi:hypothetical protein
MSNFSATQYGIPSYAGTFDQYRLTKTKAGDKMNFGKNTPDTE